ncbi:nucleoside hydrolase [Craterilacuibacter sinensis]|uniref:Nucleoside hydrolase n=1 Tax=Craterilacuibacter sinensis TaxID=2686017 RepID=A0A845BP85_9NEIS|nr:nucleoside hydrolase [Craterilacuibacter sinensis]MXR36988.1 nucleoside hydrolase [Craterilacuibacter sinensis]
MHKLPVIFDTDPGLDDAIALLFLLGARDEIDLLGITCVAGNVGIEAVSRNARMVCEWAGRSDIKVYAGAERPLIRHLVTAERVHGKTGMEGAPMHEPAMPLQEAHAVDFIIDTLRREPAGTVTLCPVGPLTNIALALLKAPDIAARIKQIVLMGGAYFEGGNVTPSAEFNFYVDPHSAQQVLHAGIPLVMLPLDVTHKACTSASRVAALSSLSNYCGPLAASLLTSFERHDVQKYGQMGAPLHDPCAIAWLLAPGLFSGREVNIEVETDSPLTQGHCAVDWWGTTGRSSNALYLTEVDADAMFGRMAQAIAKLP